MSSHSSKPQKEAPQQDKAGGHGGLVAITVALIAAVGGVAAAITPGMLTEHSGSAPGHSQPGSAPSRRPSIAAPENTQPARRPNGASSPAPSATGSVNGYRQVVRYVTALDSGYGIISVQDADIQPELHVAGDNQDLYYTGRTYWPIMSDDGTLAPLTDVPLSYQACVNDAQYDRAVAPWINTTFCFKGKGDGIVAGIQVTSLPDLSSPSPSPYTVRMVITVWKTA